MGEKKTTVTTETLVMTKEQRVALDALWFDQHFQPRELLPESEWAQLTQAGRNTPSGVYETLQRCATTPTRYPPAKLVLDHVEEIIQTARTDGILVPISVVQRDGRDWVIDGHCRCMAAVALELDSVPYTRVPEIGIGAATSEFQLAARRFVLNSTQLRLSPIEMSRAVVELHSLAMATIADAGSDAPAGEADRPAGGPPRARAARERAPGQTHQQDVEARARQLVLERTGLTVDRYKTLMSLRQLVPDVVDLARNQPQDLTETHLRAIVAAPQPAQPWIARLVALDRASVAATRRYCNLAAEQGEQAIVQQYADAMRRHQSKPRTHGVLSWRPLLSALPEDLTPRLSALRAEIRALDPKHRQARLQELTTARARMVEAIHAFDEILASEATPEGVG